MNKLFIVADTSASIRRPAALSALQEVIEKIYGDFADDPPQGFPAGVKLTCIRCGWDESSVAGKGKWLPALHDCGGIAPLVDCLTDTVKPLLSAKARNVVAVISDGFWCGERKKLREFEYSCYESKLCALAEINIGNNSVRNLVLPQSLRLNSFDERLTRRLAELFGGV